MTIRLKQAQDFLISAHLPGTGWAYHQRGTHAYPEPTCCGLLALRETSFPAQASLTWLASLVNAEGQLFLPQDDMPNWASAMLVITLTHLNQLSETRKSSINWLLEWKSKQVEPDPDLVKVNSNLLGWPWISDTFSWVQPTSWAVLALKLAGLGAHPRIKEAETLILDRTCLEGGWNFGAPVILNQIIDPAPVDTALALFALQDVSTASHEIEAGLDFIENSIPRFPSSLSLSLGILCLNIFGRPTDNLVELLNARQAEDGSWGQSPWWTSLAVLALQAALGESNVFKIQKN